MRTPAPVSLAAKAEAANLGECYAEDSQAADASTFQQAWAMLLKASDKLGTVASYKFDLVDLGRQVSHTQRHQSFVSHSLARMTDGNRRF